MTGGDCPFIAVLRHGGEGRHLPPDLARWAEALSHAAGQAVPLLDGSLANPPAATFLVASLGPFPDQALAAVPAPALAALAPRLVVLGLGLAHAKRLLPRWPFAAVIEADAVHAWQEGRAPAAAGFGGLIGLRLAIEPAPWSFALPDTPCVMARADGRPLPQVLVTYLRRYQDRAAASA